MDPDADRPDPASRPPPDRRRPDGQAKRLGGQRATDHYWTVPEIAADLRLQERTVWHKFLEPPDGPRLLAYYDFGGEIRVAAEAYASFKRECLRERGAPGETG